VSDIGDIEFIDFGPVRYQDHEPTMHLKFVGGILHQAWNVKLYEGFTCGVEVEWKPVPSEPAQPVEEK
jgi:hypothetical protein